MVLCRLCNCHMDEIDKENFWKDCKMEEFCEVSLEHAEDDKMFCCFYADSEGNEDEECFHWLMNDDDDEDDDEQEQDSDVAYYYFD